MQYLAACFECCAMIGASLIITKAFNMTDSNPFAFLSSGEKNLAVAISISHVAYEDFVELSLRMRSERHQRILENDHGYVFIVYCDLDMIEEEFKPFVGPSVYELILWAHRNGVRFLELDSDAAIESSLPVYEW